MRLFVLLTSLLVIVLSYYPTYHQWKQTPPDREWSGTTFFSDDYAVYLHTIRQGARGRWTVLDLFTNEPHRGSLLHIYYLLFGKFWSAFGIDPIYSYHLMRLLASITLLSAAWGFTKTVVANRFTQAIAWLLICFFNILPGKYFVANLSWLPILGEPEVTTRFAGQSHHIFGSALLLFSLTIFLRYLERPHPKLLLLGVMISFLNSWIEPNTSFATILILLTFIIWKRLTRKNSSNWFLRVFAGTGLEKSPKESIFIVLVTVFASPALLYFRLLNRTEPWKTLFIFDSFQHFNPTAVTLLSIFGITGSLTLLFLILRLSRQKQLISVIEPLPIQMILSWILVFILLYLASPILHINRLRFYHQPIFVPLAIASTTSLFYLASLISKKYPKSITLLLSLLLTLPTLPTTIASFKQRIHEYDDLSTLVYPTKYMVDAFGWLSSHSTQTDTVLALYEASNIIPVWSNNTVYAGNITETLNYADKSQQALRFYQNRTTKEESTNFLTQANIRYVYFGFQENQGVNPYSLPNLKLVYSNPQSSIFEIPASY